MAVKLPTVVTRKRVVLRTDKSRYLLVKVACVSGCEFMLLLYSEPVTDWFDYLMSLGVEGYSCVVGV